MTDPTQEQRARWRRAANIIMSQRGLCEHIPDQLLFAIADTISAEAVAAERSRVAEGAGMTDDELLTIWSQSGDNHRTYTQSTLARCRAVEAEATARATAAERERCARQDDGLADTQRMLIRNLRARGSGGVDTAITDCQMQLNAYETSAAAHRAREEG